MANYFLIGAKQLGTEIFSVKDSKVTLNFDKEIIRKIWDNYYVPFVKGYFAASGKFRSDDINTGNILSFVGSSAGATFFPDEVIVDDTRSYPVLPVSDTLLNLPHNQAYLPHMPCLHILQKYLESP